MVQRLLVHNQDLPEVARVATAVALQPFRRYRPGRFHRVGRSALDAGDVQIDYRTGLHDVAPGGGAGPAPESLHTIAGF